MVAKGGMRSGRQNASDARQEGVRTSTRGGSALSYRHLSVLILCKRIRLSRLCKAAVGSGSRCHCLTILRPAAAREAHTRELRRGAVNFGWKAGPHFARLRYMCSARNCLQHSICVSEHQSTSTCQRLFTSGAR